MMQEFTAEIEKTARSVVNDIHTAVPGEIVSYDAAAGIATVKPTASFVTSDGAKLEYPTITEAPVVFPFCQNAGVGVVYPLKPGDNCVIVFSEAELDAWRSGAESEGSMRFDLSSAMAVPVLFEGGCEASEKAVTENAVIAVASDTEVLINMDKVEVTVPETKITIDKESIKADVGGNKFELTEDGLTVDIKGTKVEVTESGVNVKGDVTIDGTATAKAHL